MFVFYFAAVFLVSEGSSPICPNWYTNAADSYRLTEAGFEDSRCFKTLPGKWDSFYEMMQYCKNAYQESDQNPGLGLDLLKEHASPESGMND